MKIITIIGARPQFIKAAALSSTIAKTDVSEIILHTGQHYDPNMSDVFFREMGIPDPAYNLGIKHSLHGAMTGRMLEKIEEILIREKPNLVILYGDTNSTLSGAIAASKLHIPIAHIEAGLRSFNRKMPEEINRLITDHLSDFLFSPTLHGVENLKSEGITRGVHHTGDVMYDASLMFGAIAEKKSQIMHTLMVQPNEFYLATVHRAENTDDPKRLKSILDALVELNSIHPVVLPLHPRTLKYIQKYGLQTAIKKIRITHPLSFIDMISLEKNAKVIITDSGGVQKEAYFHSVPCVTLREETEWLETITAGWNVIVGADKCKILQAVNDAKCGSKIPDYGDGNASKKIVDILFSEELKNDKKY